MVSRRGVVATLLTLALAGGRPTADATARQPSKGARSAADQRRQALAAVTSWGINLRWMDKRQIAGSAFDLVVVDYAQFRHLTFEFPFERHEVAEMQARPDGRRRLVLAYLSIGEAEDYRYYWNKAWDEGTRPAWVGPENPKWPGNFPARFWLPDWQRLIATGPSSYLDRIVAAGFDGVYLDRADAYEEWSKERPGAEAEMADFIARIAAHARKANPEFLVVLQNAEELLTRAKVRSSIDAIAKEDLIYGATGEEEPNPPDMIEHSLRLLRRARGAGLPVLVLEYLADPAKVADARRKIAAERFLPHFAERSLNRLTVTAPDELPQPRTGGQR